VTDQEATNHDEAEAEWAERWPWLLPLAAGIFLGAVVFHVLPEALDLVGSTAWLWGLAGLVLFVLVRYGFDYIGQHGLGWAATLGIWLHSLLEGVATGLSYNVGLVTGLLVTVGMLLHLIPEFGAAVVLMSSAGVTRRQTLIRTGITWLFLILGFVLVFVFLRDLADPVLGATLALGAGAFIYLAYASWEERKWGLWQSLAVALIGAALMGGIQLIVGR
jgi:zinc transporter ZupT